MPSISAEFISYLQQVGFTKKEIEEAVTEASGPHWIRELSELERNIFAGSIARAVQMAPFFRDGLSLLRPYKDATTNSLYIDKHSRVGIGPVFFHSSISSYRRASYLLHEVMHVLSHHFTRESPVSLEGLEENIAKDFEINTTLDRMPNIDLGDAVMPNMEPWNYPTGESFEQYAIRIGGDKDSKGDSGAKEGGQEESDEDSSSSESSQNGENPDSDQGNSNDSEGSPDGSSVGDNQTGGLAGKACDNASEARSNKADKEGIDKASTTEQTVARKNTEARIEEERQKAKQRGDQSMLQAMAEMSIRLQPAKVDWRKVFRKIVSKSCDRVVLGRSDYTYRRISRRLSDSPYIFPGMVKYEPKACMAIDTSGSMQEKDFIKLLSELQTIIKRVVGRKNMTAFPVDAEAGEPSTVNDVQRLQLRGGGGTDMSVAVKSVAMIPKKKRPDILIVATDGGTDWRKISRELQKPETTFETIFLLTEDSFVKEATKELQNLATVIDISAEG